LNTPSRTSPRRKNWGDAHSTTSSKQSRNLMKATVQEMHESVRESLYDHDSRTRGKAWFADYRHMKNSKRNQKTYHKRINEDIQRTRREAEETNNYMDTFETKLAGLRSF
jgi:hypothetical protein